MQVRGLLLDVEGVLVADKRYQPVPGAVDFVEAARRAGIPLRLITNNTTDDRPTLLDKLTRAGFTFELRELHTCTAAAVNVVRAGGAARCLVLGNEALRRIFAQAGLEVVDDAAVDAVVVGLDTDLTFTRLQAACEAIVRHEARLIALHRNRIYTDGGGRVAPSVGALVAAIEYATQAGATVIGKPSAAYFQQALDELERPSAEVLVVSDDPFSDLVGAQRMGMRTALVLSGKYGDECVMDELDAAERPDHVAATINDLLRREMVRFG